MPAQTEQKRFFLFDFLTAPARPTGAPRPGSGGRRMVRRRSSAFIDPGLISMKPLDTHRPDELAVHMTTMIERLTSTVYR